MDAEEGPETLDIGDPCGKQTVQMYVGDAPMSLDFWYSKSGGSGCPLLPVPKLAVKRYTTATASCKYIRPLAVRSLIYSSDSSPSLSEWYAFVVSCRLRGGTELPWSWKRRSVHPCIS